MSTPQKKSRRNRPSPRSRLLESATSLFTTEGIRVIGIDRILREADVAKASLYSLFGSKDALVIAYIENLDEKYRAEWAALVEGKSPEVQVLGFFDKAIADQPGMEYRGSHFLNAAGEYPRPETDQEHGIVAACKAHRHWMHTTMTDILTKRNGYPSQDQASQLLILLDGGLAGARLQHEVEPLRTSREMASQLLAEPPADYSI